MSDVQANSSVAELEASVQAVSQPVLKPGAELAIHREARGWTVEYVANQLNLAVRQIQALEADNYAALPGMVIARGFVRAYAKLLKVDAATLVAGMVDESAVPLDAIELRRALAGTFSESHLPPAGRTGSPMKWIVISLIIMPLVYGAYSVQKNAPVSIFSEILTSKFIRSLQSVSSPSEVDLTSAAAAASTFASSTGTVELLASPENADVSAVDAPVVTAETSVLNSMGKDKPAEPLATVSATVSGKPIVSGGENVLQLKVHQDAWIDIRRAGNAPLLSRIVKAGETEVFEITQPMEMIIGNAAGVDASFRGSKLELKSSANNNVVRLSLK